VVEFVGFLSNILIEVHMNAAGRETLLKKMQNEQVLIMGCIK
jgi:hypothetical protein